MLSITEKLKLHLTYTYYTSYIPAVVENVVVDNVEVVVLDVNGWVEVNELEEEVVDVVDVIDVCEVVEVEEAVVSE